MPSSLPTAPARRPGAVSLGERVIVQRPLVEGPRGRHPPEKPSPFAVFAAGIERITFATELVDVTHDLSALDSDGRWAVVIDFEGRATCARFARWRTLANTAAAATPGSIGPGSPIPGRGPSTTDPGGGPGTARPPRRAVPGGGRATDGTGATDPGDTGPSTTGPGATGLSTTVVTGPAPSAAAAWHELAPQPWPGVARGAWASSLDRDAWDQAVTAIRHAIAAGDVYQVNLTRQLSAPLPAGMSEAAAAAALGRVLAVQHPAPCAATVVLPDHGVAVASASPERFLQRDGDRLWSSPIKGTAPTAAGLTAKDRAENVMIVDLVRNDLGRVCRFGTVRVPSLLTLEHHPGLVHLVSTVEGTLRADVTWAHIVEAAFPPGSVTGAPKLAAIDTIGRLEPVPRGTYCGTVGWVDANRATADLNVAIRTFSAHEGMLHFGTGGAITYDSTPEDEWNETELKANRLLAAASWSDASGSTVNSSTPTAPPSAWSTTA